jgi:nucleoside-diphosphate-sugar epimerase
MRKLMDSSRMRALGWKPKINLEQGIDQMISRLRTQYAASPREKRAVLG